MMNQNIQISTAGLTDYPVIQNMARFYVYDLCWGSTDILCVKWLSKSTHKQSIEHVRPAGMPRSSNCSLRRPAACPISMTTINTQPIYALVDCNNFYASCERIFNPALNHKPLIISSDAKLINSDFSQLFNSSFRY